MLDYQNLRAEDLPVQLIESRTIYAKQMTDRTPYTVTNLQRHIKWLKERCDWKKKTRDHYLQFAEQDLQQLLQNEAKERSKKQQH